MDSAAMGISIRRMKAGDAEEICSIYAKITKETVSPDFRRLIEKHADRGSKATCFVAEMDNDVVGFMISYTLPFGFGIERSAWIATMGVHPRCMGQGIGKRMAEETLGFYVAQGIRRIYTSVRWDSADVLSFFKSLGFESSDFIILSKPL